MGAPIPTDGDARQHWIKFYLWQLRKIREFAIKHPSLTYLEIPLDSTSAGQTLGEHLKLPGKQACWKPPNRDRYDPLLDTSGSAASGQADMGTLLPLPVFAVSLPKSGTTSTQVRNQNQNVN